METLYCRASRYLYGYVKSTDEEPRNGADMLTTLYIGRIRQMIINCFKSLHKFKHLISLECILNSASQV